MSTVFQNVIIDSIRARCLASFYCLYQGQMPCQFLVPLALTVLHMDLFVIWITDHYSQCLLQATPFHYQLHLSVI